MVDFQEAKMLLRGVFTMLPLIPFVPTTMKIIKKFIGLGSACKTVFKNIGSMLFNVPKRILKAAFRIQMEIAYLPFRFINKIFKFIFERKSSDTPCNNLIQDFVIEDDNDDIIEQKIGTKLKPKYLSRPGAYYVRKAQEEGRRMNAIFQELRRIQCPHDREDSKVENLRNNCNKTPKQVLTASGPFDEQQTLGDVACQVKQDYTSTTVKSTLQDVRARINDLEQESPAENETPFNHDIVVSMSVEVLQTLVKIVTQEIVLLKRRLVKTNNKMEQVLKSSDNLFEEMSKLNEQFNRVIKLSTKITDLQNKIGIGKEVLQAVETDRNEMQRKLLALERMINEEEEYLDDVSYESGYDEHELAASPCRDEL